MMVQHPAMVGKISLLIGTIMSPFSCDIFLYIFWKLASLFKVNLSWWVYVNVPLCCRSTESISNNYWHEISGKLMDALSTIKDNHVFSTKVSEDLCYSKRSPLNMFAVNEGPRLRLIWVTLQQLQYEAGCLDTFNAVLHIWPWLNDHVYIQIRDIW